MKLYLNTLYGKLGSKSHSLNLLMNINGRNELRNGFSEEDRKNKIYEE
jgi:hypothetical protein